ncbi:MAG: choice-of-anchor J domain-containing protein [Bacteroides nordii]|jgi:putative lipoprotein
MKKILFATVAVALMLGSCDHAPEFDGFIEPQPTDLVRLNLTYDGTYPSTAGFASMEEAQKELSAWLYKNYYACDEGSEAQVTYNLAVVAPVKMLTADFEGNIIVNDPTVVPGWLNVAISGEKVYQNKSYNGDNYTSISANRDEGTSVAWFISPKYKVGKGDKLSFDMCVGYYNGDCLQVLISENFQGTNQSITNKNTTWTDITDKFTLPTEPTNGYGTLASVGEMNLDAYAGKNIYVAFKYSGAADGATTTVQLDNIEITAEETTTVEQTDKFVFKGYTDKWQYEKPSEDILVNQDFEGNNPVDKTDLVEKGWLNATVQGTYKWRWTKFSGNFYAQQSANKHTGVLESWLVSPAVSLREDMILNFDMKLGYYNGDAMTILVSEDFDGETGSLGTATWVDVTSQLTIDKSSTGSYDSDFTNHTVELAAFANKKVYIAFKYLGDGAGPSTTYQLDNIYIGIKK